MNQRNEDLTTGPIIQKLLRFALPLLLGTLVQQLYSTVDLIFVGNVIDKTASAAIGASTLLITCLIGFFGGLAVGAGVVIAQSWGERLRWRAGSYSPCSAGCWRRAICA